jgi:uncharacterized protein (TIGR03437 family)
MVGRLYGAMRGRSSPASRRQHRLGLGQRPFGLEPLESRMLLHGVAGDPLAEIFVDASALTAFASVAENFDDVNSNHELVSLQGTPASIASGGPDGNFLRLAADAGADNGIIFDSVPGFPFLIVAEFDFRMTPGAEGFGFNLINSLLVPDIPLDLPAAEPGLFGSIGVGFDVKKNTGEIDDNHVSLHWNGTTVAEVSAGSVDLDRGGDRFNRAKIILSPLRNAQGGHVTILLTPLDSAGNPESAPVTLIGNVFIPTYVNYLGIQTGNLPTRRAYFSAETDVPGAEVHIDNIKVEFDPVPNVPIEAELLETTFTSVENSRIPGRNTPTADAIVRLNAPSATRVAVNYTVTSISATPGSDYQPIQSGQLIIPPFQSWGVIKVPLIDNSIFESDEAFQISLGSVEVEAPGQPPQPQLVVIPAGVAVPEVALSVTEDPAFGYNVHVDLQNFQFTPENVSGPHVIGEGYLRLSVDGRPVTRMYSPDFHIARLAPRPHVIAVEVISNDHRNYAANFQPIVVVQPLLANRTGNYAGPGLGLHEVLAGQQPRIVSLNVTPDPLGGFNVLADVENLTFAPQSASQPHVPGEGHLHIYVDGQRVGRMYAESFYLGPLSAGQHEILVEVSGNDHVIYGVGGTPIDVTTTINAGSPLAASVPATVGERNTARMTIVDDDAPQTAGQWSDISDLGFVAVHMAVLPTGHVMYWDRIENTRIYDPQTGEINEVPNPGFNSFCAGHNFLPDGRLFITGGHGVEDPYLNGPGLVQTAIYDPWTNTWEAGPEMNDFRWYPTNTLLPNGEVLIMSGTKDLFWNMNDVPEVYNPETGEIRELPGAESTDWLYPFATVAPNGEVFVAGPRAESYYLNTEGEGSITPVATQNFQPFEPGEEVRDVTREYGTTSQYDSGKVLVAGGTPPIANLLYDLTLQTSFPTGEYYPTRSTEVIDLNDPYPLWKEVEDMAFGRRHGTSTILADGQVLVTGGGQSPGFNDANSAVFAAEMFDPETETWTTLSAMDVSRLYHNVAVLLPDARVAVAGGGQPISTGDSISHTELQVFSPPYLFDNAGNPAPRPTINVAPESITYGQSFQVNTTGNISDVTLVRLSATTHAFNHNQGFNRLEFDANGSGIQVTAPANSVEAVPGYYMLFVHDDQGVPSEAKMIQINSVGLDIRETASGSPLVVAESGTSATFAVALDTPPTDVVVVNVSSGDTSEVTASRSTMTFTPATWNIPQTVRVTGVQDTIFDGMQTTDITIAINDAFSDDNRFDNVADRVVKVQTTNDDAMDIRPGDKFVASLDDTRSFWGDSLQNLPDALGDTPRPLAPLGGWINLSFSHVSDELGGLLGAQGFDSSGLIEFSMDYFGTATGDGALTANFDSGAQYRLERIRVSPLPGLVSTPVANKGLLDPLTGQVLFVEAEVLVQHTLASGLGYSNRAPFGVALNLPPLLGDSELVQQARQAFDFLQPPLQELTDPGDIQEFMRRRELGELDPNEVALFTTAQFDVNEDGTLAGFEFHGESIVPTFLTPFLPDGEPPFGFPAPFTFGPNGEFYLQNPDGFWKEPTPELLEILGPNGMSLPLRLPNAAFLNMRIDFVADSIVAVDTNFVPPSLPEALGGLSLVESNGSLIALGGVQADGQINDDMYEYDPATNTWSLFTTATGQAPASGTDDLGLNIDLLPVRDAGNVPDVTGFGVVNSDYNIAKFEVTYEQWAEFLNAVAKTDTWGLFNPLMETSRFSRGLTRSGSPGNYSYTVQPGKADFPVGYVSIFDALRYTNWLHNDKPSGLQNSSTTEDGAYTFTPAGPGPRNPGARVFLPNEDEWYKAAYYKGGNTNAGYFEYPTSSDVRPTCELPTHASNASNCIPAVFNSTEVGAYPNSVSPYGTLDQGGNLFEWTEFVAHSPLPPIRGGSWFLDADFGSSLIGLDFDPRDEIASLGFRVATRLDPLPIQSGDSIPSPAVSYAAAMADGGMIYVAGGSNGNGQTLNELRVFNGATKTWSLLAPMPIPVHSAASGLVNDTLYVAGGFTTGDELVDDIQIYDLATNTWRLGAPLPAPGGGTVGENERPGRAGAASAVIGTDFYVIGGISTPDGVADGEVWIYSTRFDIWVESAPLLEPVLYASAGVVNGQLIALGGRTSIDGRSTSVHQYRDVDAHEWSKRLDSSRFPVSDAAAAVMNDRVYQVGGYINVGAEADQPGPGQTIAAIATASPRGAWTVSDDRPLVHSLSLVNSADLTTDLGTNTRAILFGHGLANALPGQMEVEIEGVPVPVFFPLDLNQPDAGALNLDRLFIHIPESVRPTPGKPYMDLKVTVAGVETNTKIDVISENNPKIFVYDFVEAEERTFLDNATAYAHDVDGNLNFPAQPARPGDAVIVYVTGIRSTTTPQDLTATMDGNSVPVFAIGPDTAGQPGVFTVVLGIPPFVTPSNNVRVTISSDGNQSNRAAISVYPEDQVPTPAASLANAIDGRPWALGSVSPFPPAQITDAGGLRIIQPNGGTLVSESGTTAHFSVELFSRPNSNVVVDVVSADNGEVNVRPTPLIFTPDNWNRPQNVTAIGVDDTFFDSTQFTPVTVSVNDALSDNQFDGDSATIIVQTANDDPLDILPGDVFNAAMDSQRSDFGDEFVNYPVDILGENPGPGDTPLLGWLDLEFKDLTPEVERAMEQQLALAGIPTPQFANLVQFSLDYFGSGRDEQVLFDTGALVRQTNNRIYTAPQDPESPDPVANQGVLDLNSGNVFYMNVTAFLANDAAQQVDNFNRFTPGLVHVYPPPILFGLLPLLGQLDPPLDIMTDPLEIQNYVNNRGISVDDVKVFSFAQFQGQPDGAVTNFEFHGETLIPQFALDVLPVGEPPFGFPPPFSRGPNGEVYFLRPHGFWKSPDQALVDHLAENPNNGILLNTALPNGAFLHPHVDFVSESLQLVSRPHLQSPASLPEELGGISLVESGGSLYAFGGHDANGTANTDMYRFDEFSNTWTTIVPASGQTPAVGHAATVATDGKIYVAGGENGAVRNDLHVYDIANNRWSTLASMPTALHSAASETDGSRLYVIGGFLANGSPTADVHIYDIATNRWYFGEPMTNRVGRAGAAAVLVHSDIYVMGGTTSADPGEASDEVWVYDMLDDNWIEAPSLLEPVMNSSASFLDNQIAVFGGRTSVDGPTTDIHQALDLRNADWRKAGVDRVPAADSGFAVLGDRVYMVGGFIELGAELLIDGPGQAISAVRSKSPRTTWGVSDDKPLVHSLSLLNAGDITPRLGENSRAIITGFGLESASGSVQVAIEGVPIDVLFPVSQNQPDSGQLLPDRIYVHIPETLQPTPGRRFMDLTVTVGGISGSTMIPVIDGNSPSLFVFDYLGDPSDRALLDDANAYAHDAAGNLNFAAQPARPGDTVTLYATGLRQSTTAANISATIDGLFVTVLAVGPDPAGMDGIMTVTLRVPLGVRPGNNVLVTIESEGERSNRAAIAVYPESEVPLPSDLLSAAEGRQWIFGLFPEPTPASPAVPGFPPFPTGPPPLPPSPPVVDIEFVPVGDPENAGDFTGFGRVRDPFEISKFEVTYGQYAAFLNAVASVEDTFNLYNPLMETAPLGAGIARTGVPGNFTYTPLPGRADFPVGYVSIFDAQRFANWLHNGQRTGRQDSTTTEDGAYTFDLFGPTVRNPGAQVFLTSEDEWYKAAYYRGGSTNAGYYLYPTQSDVLPTCEAPSGGSNSANCFPAVLDQVEVGSYANAVGPYGTFDQAGNVFEWTEFRAEFDVNARAPLPTIRGGSFFLDVDFLSSTLGIGFDPRDEIGSIGFRVARVSQQPAGGSPTSPPSTGQAALSGYVYVDVNNDGTKGTQELTMPNVPVTVSGPVTRTMMTDANGYYEFNDLPGGRYDMWREGPAAFLDGIETLGAMRLGHAEGEGFADVDLPAGANASGYNFGLRGLRPEFISIVNLLASSSKPLDLLETMTLDVSPGQPAAMSFRAAADGHITLATASENEASLELYSQDWLQMAMDDAPQAAAAVHAGETYVLVVSSDTTQGVSITLLDDDGEVRGTLEPWDVSGDGQITPFDALMIINALDSMNSQISSSSFLSHLDVNSDGMLSPFDALLVINQLEQLSNAPKSSSSTSAISAPAATPVAPSPEITHRHPRAAADRLLSPAIELETQSRPTRSFTVEVGPAWMVDESNRFRFASSADRDDGRDELFAELAAGDKGLLVGDLIGD